MNKKEFRFLLILFLLSRVLLIYNLIACHGPTILRLYDGSHYLTIAKLGYIEEGYYAFFPLYPLLIRIFHIILPSYTACASIISNTTSFISLLILNKLLEKNKYKKYLLICFIFSPILVFTTVNYTEGLFILLTLLGYYLYKKDKYIISAIIVGLSILTRNSGIILWGAIGIDMLIRFFSKKNIKFKQIVLFGIIALSIGMLYPLYLLYKTGNPFMFATVQNIIWRREPSFFIITIVKDLKDILIEKYFIEGNIYVFLLNWVSFFSLIVLGVKIFKKDKVSSIFILVSLLAFQITDRNIDYWDGLASISLYRYNLSLFPLYIYMFDKKNEKYVKGLTIAYVLLAIINSIAFYNGIFLA